MNKPVENTKTLKTKNSKYQSRYTKKYIHGFSGMTFKGGSTITVSVSSSRKKDNKKYIIDTSIPTISMFLHGKIEDIKMVNICLAELKRVWLSYSLYNFDTSMWKTFTQFMNEFDIKCSRSAKSTPRSNMSCIGENFSEVFMSETNLFAYDGILDKIRIVA